MTILRPGCKINLGLKILGRRPDGFHELESFFYPLAFPRDELRIFPANGFGLRVHCENAPIPAARNIINSAYSAFAAQTGHAPGLYARLRKGVPVGAGLGGGSADAGAFLLWLNQYCGHPLDPLHLAELAAGVGADAPFFLLNRPAMVRGKGERLTPLPFAGKGIFLVFVWPGIHVGTAWAFSAFDHMYGAKNSLTYEDSESNSFFSLKTALGETPIVPRLRNDLERPVFSAYPELGGLKKRFLEMGAFDAAMSGSGSTIFGLFAERELARAAVRSFIAANQRVFFAELKNIGM